MRGLFLFYYESMRKLIVSVSNDLVTDNRVDKTCRTIIENGYEVLLLGRLRGNSPSMNPRPYSFRRMRLWFSTGFLFYANLNIALFFKLIFTDFDILWANDLDTLPANFLVSKLRLKPLIYDSHEHFTEVPELKYNYFAKWFWKRIEAFIVPRLNFIVTVCNPIKDYFKREYNVDAVVVMNCPKMDFARHKKSKEDLGMLIDKPILVWQGGGCNIERGMEELVESMQWVDAYLYIIGGGDVYEDLKHLAKKFGVSPKISFTGRLPFEEMMQYTFNASIGLSLDKDTNTNYAISLPNKLFEYIHAEIPFLITPLSEIKPIVETFNCGEFIINHSPRYLADIINSLLLDDRKRELFSRNSKKAKIILSWEEEEKKIIDILTTINKCYQY